MWICLPVDHDGIAAQVAQVTPSHHGKLLLEKRIVDLLARRHFAFGSAVAADHDHFDAPVVVYR